jgi:hypothetical protein
MRGVTSPVTGNPPRPGGSYLVRNDEPLCAANPVCRDHWVQARAGRYGRAQCPIAHVGAGVSDICGTHTYFGPNRLAAHSGTNENVCPDNVGIPAGRIGCASPACGSRV